MDGPGGSWGPLLEDNYCEIDQIPVDPEIV